MRQPVDIRSRFSKTRQLHLMMLPGMALVLVFMYFPLAGLLMAFEDFNPSKGIFRSSFVGLYHFGYMFGLPDIWQIFWNTLKIALLKIVVNFPVPIIVALLLNEVGSKPFKRATQTIIYLPYFISWVILAGIAIDLFSLDGVVNQALQALGLQSVFFLGDNRYFVGLLVGTDVWKNFGYGTVVYLAAITGVDESLYESAMIEGASRWKQTLHITLPTIAPIIMLMLILNLGNVLNAGFDQIFNLYSPPVYQSADIIDTFVYRISMVEANYSLGTAVGLLKSVISFILIAFSYYLSGKYTDYRIF
jgi:ABC-type polysaccharide transport system, permease component